ncbi:flagellar assembly protein FliH [Franzmannia pantelleriensis]|uniref:Flagellar assembly protein FliH n=1 Tax=Franzmannia pantelleriensis TaxID=48727 RepID=A0A1G9MGM1_9GAMM|nr:flagellar assembly protein FliH [Halomonas pantelleriensis]SDL73412.1 flagellar assembly protein FliH [Halomonas pantelleriensis]
MSDAWRDLDDRDDAWRRWQMDELGQPQRDQQERERKRREAIRQQAFQRNAEIEALREKVREEARQEGFAAGQAEGYQAGYEQGLAEGREAGETELKHQTKKTLAPLAPLAQHFSDALTQLDHEIADDLVELALTTGRQLAGDALDAHPEQILDIVRELLHADPTLSGHPRLWLHPADLSLVKAHLGDEFSAAGWRLQPDDTISRGGCRVTSPSGELDATWERRWATITAMIRQRKQSPSARGDDSQTASDEEASDD